MKAFAGISNSVAGVVESTGKCEQCGSTTRLSQGVCLRCLLKEGLEAEGEASAEVFESVLGEANVPDTQWRLGNYEILEEIGRGGMGVIYRARQRHSRRVVALKRVLTYSADSHETLARFRREAEAAASLDHPNILPIYEIGETDGLPFFSMKFAAGGSLRSIASALRGQARECMQLMAKVARAIAHAHAQGILHRDLQPGNILLDGRGEPLVSDFGLAKWLDQESELTQTLTTFGTPGYIASEQAEGANFSPAADIYSLGAILFHLLAGRPPFVGANALSVIRQASAMPAPKLRSLAPAVGRDVETIAARCLQRDPKARYQTAAALAEDVERCLQGQPIVARPVSAPVRVWRWSRRNPTLAVAGGACLLLALAVAWLMRQQFPAPKTSVPEKSIAVLPFENVSDEKQNEYFADGVQDEILTDLAKVPDLKVISRTSVIRFRTGVPRDLREIGGQLGVAHIVEGSVQRSGDRVRVNAQLVDAHTDAHLWAKTYDRNLADVFAIQSEIAKSIAQELKANLAPNVKAAIEQPPTADVVAFDLYTRAKTLVLDVGFSGYKKGIDTYSRVTELLNAAVARDPNFFLAYYQLARAQSESYLLSIDRTPVRRAMVEEAVRNAERLRADAGETHLARALYFYRCYLDYDRARAEVQIAAGSLPNNPEIYLLTAYLDRRQSHWNEALQNLEKGLELDPRNVFVLRQISLTYQSMRRYAEMVAVLDRALALDPTDINSRIGRARADLHWRANMRPLHDTIHAILASNPSAAGDVADWWFDLALCERDPSEISEALAAISESGVRDEGLIFPRAYCQGTADLARSNSSSARAAFLKARAEQEKAVRDQPGYGAPVCVLGMIDAALGRKDEAIAEGRRAVEMLPVTKESVNGAFVMKYLAVIYTLCGEKDLAIEQIRTTLQYPGDLSYGLLKLHPYWDSLRGDPRFEKIVASLAPKDAASPAK